jgi:hypothetical protein
MDLVPKKQLMRTEFLPGLLQQGIETLDVPLCKILTACLAFGYVPKARQKVRVIFIPKPLRSSYELAKSFRPISLTYLKEKLTETALHDLVYKIDASLAQKECALGVFFDVKGAFDSTFFESMDDAASDHGVCSTLNRWIG